MYYHLVTESKHTTLPILKFRVEYTAQPAQTNSHPQTLIFLQHILILLSHLLLGVTGGLTSEDLHIHILYVFPFLMSQSLFQLIITSIIIRFYAISYILNVIHPMQVHTFFKLFPNTPIYEVPARHPSWKIHKTHLISNNQ